MNMKLQRTIKLTIKPTDAQRQVLLKTLYEYKDAYNHTCKVGWDNKLWNGVELHKLTYYYLREKLSLPSQLVYLQE